jgi:type IV pilus assembly protein PilW
MSLIEFIIASFLGLLLLYGAVEIYSNLKQSDQLIVGLARIQENGRIAVNLLRQEIQSAGYIGCPRLINLIIPFANTLNPPFTTDYVLKGLANTKSPSHDSILIEKADTKAYYLTSAMLDLNSLVVNPPFSSSNKNWFIISDCSTADIFQISKIIKNQQVVLITDRSLQKKYNTSATLFPLHAIVYFIAKSNHKNLSDEPIFALYRKELFQPNQHADEILEGISRMQIRYSIIDDAKQQLREDLTAEEVTAMHAWANVVSVAIALLVDSIEPVFAKPKKYHYQGKSYLALDRQLHKEWDVTIALQERIG